MRLALVLPLVLTAPLAAAQQSDVFIQQAEQALGTSASTLAGAEGARAALSDAVLNAALTTNVAVALQGGEENVLSVTQEGAGNQFALVVDGDENRVTLSQMGNDNVFLGDILGNNNTIGPDAQGNPSGQFGNGNRYELYLDGVDGVEHAVRQLGDDNSAIQTVGAGMQPVSIEQSGGATVVIERR